MKSQGEINFISPVSFYTESSKCPNCGKIIKWDSVETGNISIKIKHHQESDKDCIRESKLKDILG